MKKNNVKKKVILDFLRKWVTSFVLAIIVWFILSEIPGINSYIAKPLNVFNTFNGYKQVLLTDMFYTSRSALLGFFLGASFAMGCSLIATFWSNTKSFFSLFAMVIYSVPLIAAAPLAALIFESSKTGIVLGCIGSFLPIYLSGISYSNRTSNSLTNVGTVYGADKMTEIRFIKIPLLLRGWITGGQSAWLWAVLGALLGDFTGSRWGLGTFLTGSLVQSSIDKVWAVVLLCILISAAGVFILKLISNAVILESSHDAIEMSMANIPDEKSRGGPLRKIIAVLALLVVWQLLAWLFNKDGGIFSGPLDIFELCQDMASGKAGLAFKDIFSALGMTWLLSIAGVLLSLLIAFTLASAQLLSPLVTKPFLWLMLITQVTPIVAFVPFIAFYIGRGEMAVIVVVILSTIYPSYIVFKKALEQASQSAIDVASSFGGTAFQVFKKIRFPNAAWMSVVAFRLAIGRAILGGVTAEYLLTGRGLGGLLGQIRHQMDFRMVWFICFLIAMVTLLTDRLIFYIKNGIQEKFLDTRESLLAGSRID